MIFPQFIFFQIFIKNLLVIFRQYKSCKNLIFCMNIHNYIVHHYSKYCMSSFQDSSFILKNIILPKNDRKRILQSHQKLLQPMVTITQSNCTRQGANLFLQDMNSYTVGLSKQQLVNSSSSHYDKQHLSQSVVGTVSETGAAGGICCVAFLLQFKLRSRGQT